MRPKGSAEVLADRRRRGLKLLDKGLSLNAVARRLGCRASSVMRWREQRTREGDGVYAVHASPGRPPRLTARQKKQLVGLLLKGALSQGYRTDLWTTARVAEVITRTFGVTYHRDHVGRLLHGLDFSCQKPERRALERNEEEIERWQREAWPRIKKRRGPGGPSRLHRRKRLPADPGPAAHLGTPRPHADPPPFPATRESFDHLRLDGQPQAAASRFVLPLFAGRQLRQRRGRGFLAPSAPASAPMRYCHLGQRPPAPGRRHPGFAAALPAPASGSPASVCAGTESGRRDLEPDPDRAGQWPA